MDFVSKDFRDADGQDRDQLNRYLHGYFIANQSIHLLTRIDQIHFTTGDEVRLEVTVATVSRDAEAASAWNLAADIHSFDISMRKENGEWQVTYAREGPAR